MFGRLLRALTGRSAASPPPRPRSTTGGGPVPPEPHGPPAPGEAHELVLYKFDACPYCRRVQRTIDELGLDVQMRDTRRDRAARQEHVQRTGRTQVPCLYIDGEPLFESSDINAWLRAHAAATA